jgi:hypothetical protein
MVVPPVDEGDPGSPPRERFCRGKSPKTPSDNHDVRLCHLPIFPLTGPYVPFSIQRGMYAR